MTVAEVLSFGVVVAVSVGVVMMSVCVAMSLGWLWW